MALKEPSRRMLIAEEWMRVPGMTQRKLAIKFGLRHQSSIAMRLARLAKLRGEDRQRGPKALAYTTSDSEKFDPAPKGY